MRTPRHCAQHKTASHLQGCPDCKFSSCHIKLSCQRWGGCSCVSLVLSCDPLLELSSLYQVLFSSVIHLHSLANYLLRSFLAPLPPSPFSIVCDICNMLLRPLSRGSSECPQRSSLPFDLLWHLTFHWAFMYTLC